MRKLALPLLFLLTLPATAQELLKPSPNIRPERVVEIQLKALQQNDNPLPDFGIVQTWMFAHPRNKLITGPLERFAAMLKGANYQMMINHREHTIKTVVLTENYALFDVYIITEFDLRASFKWEVSKVKSGIHQGSWMTIAVSPPMQIKDFV